MAFTDPNNLKDPEVLGDYITAKWSESNAFIQSGVLATPNVAGISMMGSKIEIPTWKALGAMEVMPLGTDINTEGLDDFTQTHPMVRRVKGVKNLDLASLISSGSPIEETGNQLARLVSNAVNSSALATLQGCTAANSSNSVADTSAAPAPTDFTALDNVFGDTIQTYLGQGFFLMQSAAFNAYRELGVVADPLVGDAFQDQVIAGSNFYNVRGSIFGRNVIVDDELYRAGLTSKTSGDNLTYLVGQSSLLSAEQQSVQLEQSRNAKQLADETYMSFSRTMGMDGMNYTATVPKVGVSDADLRNSSNWALVAESNKFVGAASIQTNPA